jgi:hypothetical protein
MAMGRPSLLVQRSEDPEQGVGNRFFYQQPVKGLEPFPDTGNDLRWEARLLMALARSGLRFAGFAKCLLRDFG